MKEQEFSTVINRPVTIEDLKANLCQESAIALEYYSKKVHSRYSGEHAKGIVREGGRFLLYLQLEGFGSTKGIGYLQVLDYISSVECRTEKTRDARIGRLRVFLRYLSETEALPGYLVLLTDKFAIGKLVVLDGLPEGEKAAFFMAADTEVSQGMPCEQYFSAYTSLSRHCLPAHNYSKTMLKTFRLAWRDFYIFLCVNGLPYSLPLADQWVESAIKGSSMTAWKTYRRAFRLFEQFVMTGDIDPGVVYSYGPDKASGLPGWSRKLLLDYLEMKKAEGQVKSSIAMQKSSCMRFLSYLDRSGVTDCSMITPQIVTGFHACDHHRTIEGKNAYSVRVRQFIDFLAEQGLVTSTLRLAIPTNSAKATRIIEVLTAEEREAIDQYRSSASTPMELRNIAMVSLGYRMGLRCTDVVGVRLRDIRWQTQTIAIVQQKTGYPVTLPMPTDVANCLYNYIMHGRPESASEHLFIAMRVPFGALNRTVCAKALNTVLQQQGKVRGFHITRRTFASRMLAHHVPFDTISDALGHRQRETVFSYLATDEGGLRGCAIRLSAIPQDKGGQRW